MPTEHLDKRYYEVTTPIKIWHDDVRSSPDNWLWARTNEQAQHLLTLESVTVTEISLDHDLGLHNILPGTPGMEMLKGGAAETGLDLVLWMIKNNRVPLKVTIHSWNPVGAQRMKDAFADAGRHVLCEPYKAS